MLFRADTGPRGKDGSVSGPAQETLTSFSVYAWWLVACGLWVVFSVTMTSAACCQVTALTYEQQCQMIQRECKSYTSITACEHAQKHAHIILIPEDRCG